MANLKPQQTSKTASGVPGLDEVLSGGLPKDHLYLLQGKPGTGKTTMALQFLLEGARLGEKVLYVTFSETKVELDAVAESHGWDMSGLSSRTFGACRDHGQRKPKYSFSSVRN